MKDYDETKGLERGFRLVLRVLLCAVCLVIVPVAWAVVTLADQLDRRP